MSIPAFVRALARAGTGRPAVLAAALLAIGCATGGTGAAGTTTGAVKTDASAGDSAATDAATDAGVVDVSVLDAAKPDAADAKADVTTADTPPDTLPPQGLDAFMAAKMDEAAIPGLTACIFKNGKVAWCKAWGDADVDEGLKASPGTVYGIGSLSATVTGVAAMQLVEAGKLALDEDIDKYLPFSVRNPKHAKDKITLRMLLANTSGLLDPSDEAGIEAVYVPGDPSETLAQFAANYFKVGGKYYSKANFADDAPGAALNQGLAAHALAGYLVEVVSKEKFDDYCKAHLFTPLKMTASTWRFGKVDPKALATMYYVDEDDELAAWAQATFLGYPASNLYTSAADYARFFLAIALGGSLDGAQILKPATVDTMVKPVIEIEEGFEQALVWTQIDLEDGQLVGQNGAFDFTGVEAYYRVGDKTGYVLFTNGGWAYSEDDADDLVVYEIEDRLLEEADLLK